MGEYYEIKIGGYNSIYCNDTQELIRESNELMHRYGITQFEIITHKRAGGSNNG